MELSRPTGRLKYCGPALLVRTALSDDADCGGPIMRLRTEVCMEGIRPDSEAMGIVHALEDTLRKKETKE